MNHHILKKPVITEKSLNLIQTHNRYTFEVAQTATKDQIKQAIQDLFQVKVISINTGKVAGQRRRAGRLRRPITRPDTKKAIVQLKPGQKIDLFEVKE